MAYTGYPQTASTKEEVRIEWENMFNSWKNHRYLDYAHNCIENLLYAVNTGQFSVADYYRATGRKPEGTSLPLMDLSETYENTPIKELTIEHAITEINLNRIDDLDDLFQFFIIKDGMIIEDTTNEEVGDYFYDDNFTTPEPEQDEDDPDLFHVRFYTAYGGPTIFIEWTFRVHSPHTPHVNTDKFSIEMVHIKFVYAWWTQGGTLNLTNNKDAITMYEESGLLEDYCYTRMREIHNEYYNLEHNIE